MRNLGLFLLSFLLFFSCNTTSKTKFEISEKKITSEFNSVKFESALLEKTNFLNGDAIEQAQSPAEWKALCATKTPTWCYADEKSKKGILYNYYVLQDKREILDESQQLNEIQAKKLNAELLESKNFKFDLGKNSTMQRSFYGSNCDLSFFQTWIFKSENVHNNIALTMVWDLKRSQFRIDSVSMNNGFRIWAIKK